MNAPLNMLHVIQAGAAATIAADPRPLSTMEVIDRLGDELAVQGPLGPRVEKEEPLPGITHYGRIFDQPLYTAAFLARQKAREAELDAALSGRGLG